MTEFSQPCCMTLYPSFPVSNTGNTYQWRQNIKSATVLIQCTCQRNKNYGFKISSCLLCYM